MRQKIIFKSTFIFILLRNRQLWSFCIIPLTEKNCNLDLPWWEIFILFLENYLCHSAICARPSLECKTFFLISLLRGILTGNNQEMAKKTAGVNLFRSATTKSVRSKVINKSHYYPAPPSVISNTMTGIFYF